MEELVVSWAPWVVLGSLGGLSRSSTIAQGLFILLWKAAEMGMYMEWEWRWWHTMVVGTLSEATVEAVYGKW